MEEFSIVERIFIVKNYYLSKYSTTSVQNDFISAFERCSVPTDIQIVKFVKLFEEFGNVCADPGPDGEIVLKNELDWLKYEEEQLESQTETNQCENDECTKDSVESRIDESNTPIDEVKKEIPMVINVVTKRKRPGKYNRECPVCNKVFTRKLKYNLHIAAHKRECEICGKKYHNREVHMQQHTNEKTLPCPICSTLFSNQKRLNSHMRVHTDDRPYECEVCNKQMKTKYRLTEHMRYHSDEKPYPCKECDKKFKTSSDLRKHEIVHSVARPFICSYCGNGFKVKYEHDRHIIAIHTGEKSYKCEICAKSFNHKGSCTTHMRIHTGEKPFPCKFCDKSFSVSGTRTRHERTHTGEYPHVCFICGKAHNHPGNLKSHMRSVHQQES